MANSFNVPQKGGNICGKFVSTQNSRNAIYDNVSMDLTPLNRQQQKLAGAFENIVAGVAKTLEDTKTGWTIDSEFKDGENIKPEITLPQITSLTENEEIESWNSNNSLIFSTNANVKGQLLFEDSMSEYSRFCRCRTTVVTGGGTWSELQVAILNKNDNNYISISEQVYFVTAAQANRPNEVIEIITGGFYLNQSGQTCIMVFLRGKDNDGIPKLYLGKYQIGSNPSGTEILIDVTPNNYSTLLLDSSSLPIVAATYNNITSKIHTFIAKTDHTIWYTEIESAYYSLQDTSKYCYNVSNNWFSIAVKNEATYLAVLDGNAKFQVYKQLGNSWNNYWNNITSFKENDLSGMFFGISQNNEYMIILAQHTSSCEVFLYNNTYGTKIELTDIKSCCVSDKYLYLSKVSNSIYECYQYNLQSQELSSYVQKFTTTSTYGNLFYFDCFYFICKDYLVQIHNKTEVEVFIETEEDVPLSAHVNLTHSSQNKLQISCQYNSKKQLLFDNNNNALYGNDIGFTFLNKDSDISFETVPSLHICKNNDGTPAGGLFYNEIISNVGIGDLEYYIVANKDGNFIDLMVKSQTNTIIANIGCGNLINKLYYPEVDIDANAHVMYFALGFVKNDLSAVPDNANPNSLVAMFVAPTYNGFRYYSGTNNVSSLDLVYKCQTSSYKYHGTLNLTLTYTMPLILAITGTNTVYYFNGESGFKGEINRAYLVQIKPENSIDTGMILDNGNYLYLGNLWAIGWDATNKASINPYNTEE